MGVRCPHMFLILLLLHGANAALSAPVQKWQTLSGDEPIVIARGGFSGIFPDSSQYAYQTALSSSLPNVALFCDLKLSSDDVGFCKTGLTLDNSTLISDAFPKRAKTYKVNGEDIHGWFATDFTSDELFQNVTLIQDIFSRPSVFDGYMGMYSLDDVVGHRPTLLWINVEYDLFYQEQKFSNEAYILSVAKDFNVNYVSSPEVGFLKSLRGKLRKSKVKLIFRFLDEELVEPTTKQTYGKILEDLKSIKAFASGILVPKNYIWPINQDYYLEPATSLVKDAHALGLEVYAFGFANDVPSSYNYSYDPSAEYLQFIDNSDFSVDGVLTDFPSTASGAIACLAHAKDNPIRPSGKGGRPLIITHNGASGVFAGSSNLAYQQAVRDGADIIDCSVQMTRDRVPFCLDSPDLTKGTTAPTTFVTKVSTVNEVQKGSGIFSFNLSWSEIQTLKPDIVSPYSQAGLKRNPAGRNSGKLMNLADFLTLAKSSNISGILINIHNAPFLATIGLDMVDAISSELVNAGFDKETRQQVFIETDDSAVLKAFKKFPMFQRVLVIDNRISDASKSSVEEIKDIADAVTIKRTSIAQINGFFLMRFTDVVNKMHAANISVYVGVLKNEFMNLAFDFWADPIIELATYTSALMVDGIVTEYPATAAAFFKSPCSDFSKLDLPYTFVPTTPGSLLNLAVPGSMPPAEGPAPILKVADIVDPPLPSVAISSPPVPTPAIDPTAGTMAASAGANANAGLSILMASIVALLALSFH